MNWSLKIIRHILLIPTTRIPVITQRKINSTRTAYLLSYKILGEDIAKTADFPSPPVFIFHGLISCKKDWESIGKVISNIAKRIIVVVDLRNHGLSPHANSHKYEDIAADIVELIDKLGIKEASLMGYSMGGRAAMYTALTMPSKVSGLIVIETSPITTPPQYMTKFGKILHAMCEFHVKHKDLDVAKEEVKRKLKEVVPISDLMMKTVLSNLVIKKQDGKIGWTCNVDVLLKHFNHMCSFPTWKDNKMYLGPTAFIGGQLSNFIPPDDLPRIRQLFPKAVICYLEACGHELHDNDPRGFIQMVLNFLRMQNNRNGLPTNSPLK